MRVRSLGGEGPLEEQMTIHSSILAWEIPLQRNLVSYSPWGCKALDTTENKQGCKETVEPTHVVNLQGVDS